MFVFLGFQRQQGFKHSNEIRLHDANPFEICANISTRMAKLHLHEIGIVLVRVVISKQTSENNS